MYIQIAETREEIEFCKRGLSEFRSDLNTDLLGGENMFYDLAESYRF
jgi:hypothetical protein